jgi:adhesin transport system outer membrane protein
MACKKLLKVLIPCIGFGLCAPVGAHTVQEAVSLAIETGPDMLKQADITEQTRQGLKQSYGGYLPSVDVTAGWGREDSNNTTTRGVLNNGSSKTLTRKELGVTARQMLFDGFAVKNDVEGNMSRLRAESLRTDGVAQDIALKVIEFFLSTNSAKHVMDLAKANLDSHLRIFSQIQKRSEGGVARKADLDQAEARVAFSRSQLVGTQVNYKDAQSNFQRLVGIPAHGLIDPEVPVSALPKSLRSAIAMAINNNSILKATVSDVAVTKHKKKSRQAAFYPRLDLEVGATNNQNLDGVNGSNNDMTAMLRARWNLFAGGQDIASVRQASWEIQEAQETRVRAHREAEEAVRLAWAFYTGAKANRVNNLQHCCRANT